MSINKIKLIKAEIERLKNELIQEVEKGYKSEFDEGRISAFEDLLIYIDSLEEPISNDLEAAAVEAFKHIVDSDKNNFLEIFKAGAQWQKQQDQSTIELAEDHAYLAGQEQIIDKACEWLNLQLNLPIDFEQHFRKAMEE